MQQPLLSVIVPIYNVENYLDRCVESIVKQTYTNLEIILVDDGSPDNCPIICDEWAKKDKRINVIHKVNAGAAAARNSGLEYATGDIVAFVDADDWIDQNMYERMIHIMETDNSDIVVCGNVWITEEGREIKKEGYHKCSLDNKQALECLFDQKLKEQVWDKIYKKSIVSGIFFIEGRKIDDIFWTYRVLGNAKKVSVIDESFYNYFQNKESVMGMGYKNYWLDALDAMELRCEYIKTRFPELYDKSLYVYISDCFYHLQYAIYTHQDQKDINNILNRFEYMKTGHPTRGLGFKKKMLYYLFTFFPIITCKIRNSLGRGL